MSLLQSCERGVMQGCISMKDNCNEQNKHSCIPYFFLYQVKKVFYLVWANLMKLKWQLWFVIGCRLQEYKVSIATIIYGKCLLIAWTDYAFDQKFGRTQIPDRLKPSSPGRNSESWMTTCVPLYDLNFMKIYLFISFGQKKG